MIISRLTTTERDNLTPSPIGGYVIYNTTTNKYQIYNFLLSVWEDVRTSLNPPIFLDQTSTIADFQTGNIYYYVGTAPITYDYDLLPYPTPIPVSGFDFVNLSVYDVTFNANGGNSGYVLTPNQRLRDVQVIDNGLWDLFATEYFDNIYNLQQVTSKGNTTFNNIHIQNNPTTYEIFLTPDGWFAKNYVTNDNVWYNNRFIRKDASGFKTWFINFPDLSTNLNNSSINVDFRPNVSGTVAYLSDIANALTNFTLQDVTNNGNTTSNPIKITDGTTDLIRLENGGGEGLITIYNDAGTFLSSFGVNLFSGSIEAKTNLGVYDPTTTFLGAIRGDNLTNNRTYQVPDNSGTLALTSDINNIYNSDGTINSTRLVDVNNNSLNFFNANQFQIDTVNGSAALQFYMADEAYLSLTDGVLVTTFLQASTDFQLYSSNGVNVVNLIVGTGGASTASGVTVIDDVFNKGITATNYFGANYDDNTYVQKKFVDDTYVPLAGTTLLNPITGDFRLGDDVDFSIIKNNTTNNTIDRIHFRNDGIWLIKDSTVNDYIQNNIRIENLSMTFLSDYNDIGNSITSASYIQQNPYQVIISQRDNSNDENKLDIQVDSRYINNQSVKTGIRYEGFGESDIDGTGANYNTLVGTSLAPKALVESIVAGNTVTYLNPVISILNTPPGSPAIGDRYLIGTAPTGVWVGLANQIAEWNGTTWVYTIPVTNNVVYVTSTLLTYRFNGTNWLVYQGTAILQNGNTLGTSVSIGSNDAQQLLFRTGGVERFRIPNGLNQFQANGVTGTAALPLFTSSITSGSGLWFTGANGTCLSGGGNQVAQFNGGAGIVNYLNVTGSTTGNSITIGVNGTDLNAGINIATKGTGNLSFLTNGTTKATFDLDGGIQLFNLATDRYALTVTNTVDDNNYTRYTGSTVEYLLGFQTNRFLVKNNTTNQDLISFTHTNNALTLGSTTPSQNVINLPNSNAGYGNSSIGLNSSRKFYYTDGTTVRFFIRTTNQIATDTTNYETLVTNNNDIPNKKYVDDNVLTSDREQTHTTGATVTINNNISILYVNPATTLASLTITLPATPVNGQEVKISFGGTVTAGSVITTLSIVGNTGHTILGNSIVTADAGDGYIFKFQSSTNLWRIF